jgi:DNA-binding NtrC family response regulator
MVRIPPLRERREELPWIVETVLGRLGGLRPHAAFIEAALLRPWAGNARELVNAVTIAAQLCTDEDGRLKAVHLGELGNPIGPAASTPNAGTAVSAPPASPAAAEEPAGDPETASRVVEVLKRQNGNVTSAARELGLHRNQLRRWLARHGVDPEKYKRDIVLPDED